MGMQKRFVVTATGDVDFGSASDEAVAGWAITLTDGGSLAGLSCVPQRKLTGATSAAWANAAYKDMADETVKTAALTAAPQNIYVISDGWDIRLNITAISAGSLIVEATARMG